MPHIDPDDEESFVSLSDLMKARININKTLEEMRHDERFVGCMRRIDALAVGAIGTYATLGDGICDQAITASRYAGA